jgi:hypothetical protein
MQDLHQHKHLLAVCVRSISIITVSNFQIDTIRSKDNPLSNTPSVSGQSIDNTTQRVGYGGHQAYNRGNFETMSANKTEPINQISMTSQYTGGSPQSDRVRSDILNHSIQVDYNTKYNAQTNKDRNLLPTLLQKAQPEPQF